MWLFNTNRTRWSTEARTWDWKNTKNLEKCFAFIQPLGFAAPTQPVHLRKWFLKCFLGKIKKDGREFPVADIAITKVTSAPRSEEVMHSICLLPRRRITRLDACTVMILVSFIFQIFWHKKWNLSITFFNSKKKFLTLIEFKLVTHACRFRVSYSQVLMPFEKAT